MISMILSSSVSSWYDCVLKCTFIWINYCLSFFFALLNWSDFLIFRFCCWCCSSSCLMHICIWVIILVELLVDSAVFDAESLRLLSIMIFFFLKCFCLNNIYLFWFQMIFSQAWFCLKYLYWELQILWNCSFSFNRQKLLKYIITEHF